MEDYNTVVLIYSIITGLLGVILNGIFIVVTIFTKELHNGYAWFVCGLAVDNLLYCLNDLTLETSVIVFDLPVDSVLCSISGIIFMAFGIGGLCIQPLIAVNRYVIICHPNWAGNVFSHTQNIFFTCGIFIFCLAIAFTFWLMGDVSRFWGTLCGPRADMPMTHKLLFAIPMFGSYAICIYCGYKIIRLLKNHQDAARRFELGSRLQDAHDIITLLIVELLVPIIFETPTIVCTLLYNLHVSKMTTSFLICLFITHPILDPIIVVIIMKPYRKFFQRKLLKCKSSRVEPANAGLFDYDKSVQLHSKGSNIATVQVA